MFAGSCVGVVLLTMSLAFLRRLHRAYDAHVAAQQSMMRPMGPPPPSQNSAGRSSKQPAATRVPPLLAATGATASTPRRYSLLQQTIRAFLHMLQFAVAYFVMLLAMYYNGYIIISIFIGAFLGYFVFEWEAAARLVN
ncbi:Ctr copper transporter [Xylariaceae sp. FL0804]|nr:Ctr copper transporter [Xylariaceae sp. FL0804]